MWDVDFEEIGKDTVTMTSAAGLVEADEGKVGKVTADKTIGLCDAEDAFYGVIDKVDLGGGVSGVQRKGFKLVSYSGADPALGYTELVADGAGGVKVPAVAGTGRIVHIVGIDAVASTVWIDLG